MIIISSKRVLNREIGRNLMSRDKVVCRSDVIVMRNLRYFRVSDTSKKSLCINLLLLLLAGKVILLVELEMVI